MIRIDKPAQQFRYVSTDDGFVRTYFRGTDDRKLYCFQPVSHGSEWPARYEFLVCTRDGEPVAPYPFTPAKDRFDRFELPPWGRKPA